MSTLEVELPELPEVETVRRGLEPVMVGQRIERLECRRPDLRFPFPEGFVQRIVGATVTALDRRAKYLLVRLDRGETILMHLGMTGRFSIEQQGAPAEAPGRFEHASGGDTRHDHVVFHLGSGARVTYNDARRFGFMLLVGPDEEQTNPMLAPLGVEPLSNDLTAEYLAQRARNRRTDLKSFLMDQRIVAGLGNIYVCEALYRARLDPSRPAGGLARMDGKPTARAVRLVGAIRDVLAEALAAGGSSLRDYRHADGGLGYFQHSFSVYGRDGKPCKRPDCRGMVQREIHAGRSTFRCNRCQR